MSWFPLHILNGRQKAWAKKRVRVDVSYAVEYDPTKLEALVCKAAWNQSQTAKIGPIRVTITSVKEAQNNG